MGEGNTFGVLSLLPSISEFRKLPRARRIEVINVLGRKYLDSNFELGSAYEAFLRLHGRGENLVLLQYFRVHENICRVKHQCPYDMSVDNYNREVFLGSITKPGFYNKREVSESDLDEKEVKDFDVNTLEREIILIDG